MSSSLLSFLDYRADSLKQFGIRFKQSASSAVFRICNDVCLFVSNHVRGTRFTGEQAHFAEESRSGPS